MPASTQPTWSKSPCCSARRAATNTSRSRKCAVVDELGHRSRPPTRRCRPGRARRPTRRACGCANAAREVGADRVLHRVVGLVREPLLAAERAAEVREELRLDRADRDPAVVGAAVDVVAGVAAGEDVVARARGPRRSRGTRRRTATSARPHRRRPTRRGTRLRRSRPRRTSAARIAITACMPPPAASPIVAPGSAGPPSASRPEQSR